MYSSLANWVLGLSISLPLLALLTVCARFYTRRKISAGIKADDWLIVLSLMNVLAQCGVYFWSIHKGCLGITSELTESEMICELKTNYMAPFFMDTSLGLVKMSVLCFYKRIFISRSFRLVANILLTSVILWTIASLLCQLFQEWPISGNWSLAMGNNNSLINDSVFLFSYFIIDLAFDLVIMSLPLNEIRKLNLGLQKRLALASIFALGLIAIVACCIRIYQQYVFLYMSPSEEFTSLYSTALIRILGYSITEPCVSIVAASLPSLAPLFPKGWLKGTWIKSFRSLLSPFRSRDESREMLAEKIDGMPKFEKCSSEGESVEGGRAGLGTPDSLGGGSLREARETV